MAIRWALNIETDNKRKPRLDLVKEACRERAFILACNIITGRPRWLLSHAKLFAFFEFANKVYCLC